MSDSLSNRLAAIKEKEKIIGLLTGGWCAGILTMTLVMGMTGNMPADVRKKCQEEAVQHGYAHYEPVIDNTTRQKFIWNK